MGAGNPSREMDTGLNRGDMCEKYFWIAGIFSKIHYLSFAFFAPSLEMGGCASWG